MNASQIANEVRDLNLSFLMLAQSAIRSDKPLALYRLGLSEHVADLVEQLSPQQMLRIASRNQTMCTVRFDDELIWGLLSDSHAPQNAEGNADRLHASVLMAGRVGALAN
jgi:flagellar transcriptional activator FlhD